MQRQEKHGDKRYVGTFSYVVVQLCKNKEVNFLFNLGKGFWVFFQS